MKMIIDVKTFIPPAGKEWDGASYPGLGFYHNPVSLQWVLVYQPAEVGPSCVIGLSTGARCPFPAEEFIESKPAEAASGIQASDILKAIAISQTRSWRRSC